CFQVDSANRHGILLDVVQVLTDLNLVVRKAYISSNGRWFMDVFSVTDQDGILHKAYRWIPCEIRCRETKGDSVS
ncbi:hypothetical protein Leryth_003273, partial [Lithospermum erythrorhizon]